jgi:hypothetical protein
MTLEPLDSVVTEYCLRPYHINPNHVAGSVLNADAGAVIVGKNGLELQFFLRTVQIKEEKITTLVIGEFNREKESIGVRHVYRIPQSLMTQIKEPNSPLAVLEEFANQ